jgi:hypothetical protein
MKMKKPKQCTKEEIINAVGSCGYIGGATEEEAELNTTTKHTEVTNEQVEQATYNKRADGSIPPQVIGAKPNRSGAGI